MKALLFRLICTLLPAMVCCPEALYAEKFRFRHYEIEDGLPSNTIRSLVQDSRGFLWFGTENGLSRFDGHTFRNFHSTDHSTALGSNYIYALYEDTAQKLWVGTDDGIYLYLPAQDEFVSFNKKTREGVHVQSQITGILEDRAGNLWIATLTQGVFRYRTDDDQLFQYQTIAGEDGAYDLNMALTIYVDKEGTVWASPHPNNRTLIRYDAVNDRFVSFPIRLEASLAARFGIYAILEDANGHFWLGTWAHGLCRLDRQTGEICPFLAPGTPNGISHIHNLAEYLPGVLLVGSDDGLSYFDTNTGESELMTSSEFKNSSLSDKFVYPIFKDREGGLWVGTYYGGVNYAPPRKGNIEGYAHSRYVHSVGGNIISCFCEDPSGKIWIGSDDGGLSLFDPQEKTFRNYRPEPGRNSLSYHNIHALCLDEGKLWIGTYSGGLNALDLKTNRFSHYDSKANDPSTLYGNSVYSIYTDDDRNLWVGTMEGICLYDREKDAFIRMKEVGTTIVDIADSRDGNVWFATWGKGVFRYNKHDKSWHHYLHSKVDPASIPNNQVNCFHFDDGGRLWLATENGAALYRKENNSFQTLPLEVTHTLIYYVRNLNGNLWLATLHGLICYSLIDKKMRTFYRNDGLQSDHFNVKAGLVTSTGDLYLGTTNGFNIIRPGPVFENDFIPPVYITNIQLFNKDIPIREKGILTRSPLYTDRIDLSHKENVLSIEYVALGYSAPAKHQFQYKLEGFDREWNQIGTQRKATYTNLPAGKYLFRVKSSDSDGDWSEGEATLSIVVHPPFWLTPLAYVCYVALFAGLLGWFFYILRRRTEIKHKRRIRKLKEEKEKELHKAKINFFTLVAHEIRTPVSLIIGPLEKIMEKTDELPEPVVDSLQLIDRNSQRLLALVNQLLDFRKAEEGAFVIQLEEHVLFELLQSLYARFRPIAEQKGLSLSLEMEEQDLSVMVDAEALTKIVSNLLTNALKHAKSKIRISCSSNEETFSIRVIDDGPGVLAEEQKNIFLPFYQVNQSHKPGTGIGLSLVKLLADAHHGTVDVMSSPGEDTAFILTLPKKQTAANGAIPQPVWQEAQPGKKESKTTSGKPLLLIVEDNSDMRKFLVGHLAAGFHITEARNGKQGLEKLRKQPIDIIVSDIMMPVMDGLAFTREVKGNLEFSHIPLILLTAKTDKDSKLEGMQSGADAYIEKPFSPQLLQAQMNNLLKSRRSLREKFSGMPFIPLDSVAVNKADEQFLHKMNRIIEENISNTGFSVDQLAEHLCIGRSRLFAKVKSLVEMTPNELIQLIRLKKAAVLLSEGEYRINEISYQVGFNNPSYFAKCFQKQFGVLPKDFTKQL